MLTDKNIKELWTKDIDDDEVKNHYKYMFELKKRLENPMKVAKEELKKTHEEYKHFYGRKTRPRQLSVCDKVLMLLPID